LSENQSRKFISVLAQAVTLWQGLSDTDLLVEMQTANAPSQWLVEAQGDVVQEDKWIVLSNELMDSYLFSRFLELTGEVPAAEWCRGHEFVMIPAFLSSLRNRRPCLSLRRG
jgi:hypothetical protein